MTALHSYVGGRWQAPADEGVPLHDAVTGEEIARISTAGIDTAAALEYGRSVGGPALRELTFHQRAALLKALASYLREHREELYALSARAGATVNDARFDVDGGIGVLFAYSSRGRRELPNDTVYVEGAVEPLGKGGTFAGQHVCTPMRGVAIQINAFNFPMWGPLEKLAPAFLAGMPTLIKPAEQTAYLTERLVRLIVESGLLPEGTVQLLCGPPGDLLDHVTSQDLVAFTGSAATARKVRAHPAVVRESVRFTAEADSLNCSILGPDAGPGTPEFNLYVKQLVAEMTVKAGQKCTAIRRALVPAELMDDVAAAVCERLAKVTVGDPSREDVRMGPLATLDQREEVRRAVKALRGAASLIFGDPDHVEVVGADADRGAFVSPLLLRCEDPDRAEPHEVEAFGPVSTLLPYTSVEQAVELAARGQGSLAGSVVTSDTDFARTVVLGLAPWHGRLLVLNRENAKESTGHGSPLPGLVHGGPGRAGGGEEMGGLRGVLHHMQRRPGRPEDAERGHWPLGHRRAEVHARARHRGGRAPVPQVPRRTAGRRRGDGRAPHGHARRHRPLRRVHRRHVLRAHRRGGRPGEPAVRRDRRPRLPRRLPGRRAVRRPGTRPRPGQLRAGEPPVPHAGQARRRADRHADRQADHAARQCRLRRGALGRRRHQPER
jgi:oxepin-CoA hydrolase / 3-oxo-5,6-dehydrosuberyl-CoA semialdehyde dehydrogenase